MNLKDKTLLITGGSRGIGKAIALRAAQDGANLVIVAKTVEEHPKLPGTIYTAAAEIEAAGGRALAIQTDIRDENQIHRAVEQATKTFGKIDVLVNNASAIFLAGTLETPMKRYDLMHSVNARGTYAMSQACLPSLLQADNPHILNISPPLDLQSKWFAPHVAYSMAKFGMSLCVLGMAEEFRDQGIAVNALWPRTAIATAAIQNLLGGAEAIRCCRQPSIMADAAYLIVTQPSRELTGQFLVDDQVLADHGITNFEDYAVDPTQELLLDFFINEINHRG